MSRTKQRINHTPQRRLAPIMFTANVGYGALTRKKEPLALEMLDNPLKNKRSIKTATGVS